MRVRRCTGSDLFMARAYCVLDPCLFSRVPSPPYRPVCMCRSEAPVREQHHNRVPRARVGAPGCGRTLTVRQLRADGAVRLSDLSCGVMPAATCACNGTRTCGAQCAGMCTGRQDAIALSLAALSCSVSMLSNPICMIQTPASRCLDGSRHPGIPWQ
jgi:hypothetical protein